MPKIIRLLKSVLQTIKDSFFRSEKINSISHETPPSFVNEITVLWSGDFNSWNEVKEIAEGYDSAHILEKCKTSLLKVKGGEVAYERDSVLFNEIQYSWPLLAGLQRAALENKGKLCIMDFGGSLGSTYYQNKEFLKTLKELQWCIVEQSDFVDCGKKYFEDEQLKFYHTIDECVLKYEPQVLILSGVLQYLEKPYEWLEKFLSLKIPYIIIDRTAFVKSERDILTLQNVPEGIYKASYPAWFFSIDHFKEQFKNYTTLASFDTHEGVIIHLDNGLTSTYKGYILKYRDNR